MAMKNVSVGIIGCGNISDIYIKNCSELFSIFDVKACSDIIPERAKAMAEKHGIPKACTVEELLGDSEIQMVINLTVPEAHSEICNSALKAGKHVYVEKPLALSREEGKKTLDMAKSENLIVGAAPDTFLGGGLQTCKKLIQDGWIGKPISATAFYASHGHEGWHPNPEFFYKPGGGPLLDMGPYYITALVSLLGPVNGVCGMAKKSFAERTITSDPNNGKKIKVEVPTHVTGIIDFESGATANLITSWDIWDHHLPYIEIYGSEGTMAIHNPNNFGGQVLLRRSNKKEWISIPAIYGFEENSRGIGAADMAYSIISDKHPRASGELAYHVLDVMLGILDSAKEGNYFKVESSCRSPEILSLRWPEDALN